MKFSVQVIVHPDGDTGASPVVREVFTFDREGLAPDTLGLQLAEAKDLLVAVQDTVVEQHASAAIARQVACPHCGVPRRHKDIRTIVVRSLFGALRLASPRWWHCGCRDQRTRTFQPLAGLLPERTTPELAYLQARLAGLIVNQVISKRMVKKQQMRWTPRGAHLLLQVRTRVLNDQLASDFRRWYPGLIRAPDPVPLAA